MRGNYHELHITLNKITGYDVDGKPITELLVLDGTEKISVNLVLYSVSRSVDYTIAGSVMSIPVKDLGVGEYGLEIKIIKGSQPLRYFDLSFSIVESNSESNIASSAEFDVESVELSPAVIFAAGSEWTIIDDYWYKNGVKTDHKAKGDPFIYSDFTTDEIAELQKPATDAIQDLNTLETNISNAETSRVNAENTRNSNEVTRNNNESIRISNENSRQTSETKRVNSENSRVDEEDKRVTAETSRVTAEKTREDNETARVNSETSRVSTEKDRESAESNRETNTAKAITDCNTAKDEANKVVSDNATNFSNLSLKERSNWQGVTLNNNLTIPSPPFSIELWVDTTGASTGEGNSMLVLKGGTVFTMYLYNVSTQNSLRFICTNTNTSIITDGCKSNLRHFAITVDKDYNWTLYVNGMASTSLNVPETASINNYVILQIAKTFYNVRTFNYALSQSDVNILYNQGRCNDVNLDTYYKSNDIWSLDFSNIQNLDGWCNYGVPTVPAIISDNIIKISTNKPTLSYSNGIFKILFDYAKHGTYILELDAKADISDLLFNVGINPSAGALHYMNVLTINTEYTHYRIEVNDRVGLGFFNLCLYPNYTYSNADNNIYIKNIKCYSAQCMDEFIPQNLCADKWINSGVNTANMALSSPVFTSQPPYLDNQFGSGAPSIAPVAAGQHYLDYTNEKNYVCCGKLYTVQYAVSHWKVQN